MSEWHAGRLTFDLDHLHDQLSTMVAALHERETASLERHEALRKADPMTVVTGRSALAHTRDSAERMLRHIDALRRASSRRSHEIVVRPNDVLHGLRSPMSA